MLLTLLAIFSLIAGVIHGAIGFGYGIVALALMPLVINARDAHVVISASGVPVLMMAAWAYRRGVEWASLRQALLGAALFLPLGLLAFGLASLDWLVRGTGLAILAMVVMSMRNRRLTGSEPASGGSCFAAGAVSGFLAGAVSIAGPPIAAFALRQGWGPERFKAFVTQCLLLIAIYKVVGLGIGGFLETGSLVQAAWVTPFAVLGIEIGARLSRRIDARRFHWLVATALVLIAASLVIRGAGAPSGDDAVETPAGRPSPAITPPPREP